MAVLFRINAQTEVFEEALGEHGIPYTLRGVEGFFQRPEVRQAVTLLRGAARAHQDDVGPLVDEVRAVLASMGHTDQAPSGSGAVRDRWESLHAITSMAADLVGEDDSADLASLVADLDRRAANAHAPTAEGVTLATLHSAKGLEWDAVFCVGMHEGMMPSVHADTAEAIDEERRLFYVGVTRARHTLTISWASTRKPGGRGNRKPSRFLLPLLPADHAARSPEAAPRAKRSAPVDSLSAEDRELFERLREWRLKESNDIGKPAFTVFSNITLLAIASSRPADRDDLAAVPGVGPAKLERYADQVLELVNG
jgi:DNA helicase-2/ATP-dependent DNA helicase PcrA